MSSQSRIWPPHALTKSTLVQLPTLPLLNRSVHGLSNQLDRYLKEPWDIGPFLLVNGILCQLPVAKGRFDNLRQQVNSSDWSCANHSQFQIITLPGQTQLKDRIHHQCSRMRIDEETVCFCELADPPLLVKGPSTISTSSSCVTPRSDFGIISQNGTESTTGLLSISLAKLQQATESNTYDTEIGSCSMAPSSDIGSDAFGSSDSKIVFLHNLPADLRSLVYGFIQHGETGQSSNSQTLAVSPGESSTSRSTQSGNFSQPNKRKQNDDDEDPPDGDKRKGSRTKLFSQSRVRERKFACPFNIMDPLRYCVRTEKGGTGDRYKACSGLGWKELRHLSDHLKNIHRPVQCLRCWEIVDNLAELSFHTDKMEPRCPDRSDSGTKKEGIDNMTWPKVQAILSTPRRSKTNHDPVKSDKDKWMAMWEYIFPHIPKPDHPNYPDRSDVGKQPVSCDGFEEILSILERKWDENRSLSNRDPTKEEVFEMLREAYRSVSTVGTTLSTKDVPWTQVDYAQAPRDRPSKPNSDISPLLSNTYERIDPEYSIERERIDNQLYLGEDSSTIDTASYFLDQSQVVTVGDSEIFHGDYKFEHDVHESQVPNIDME